MARLSIVKTNYGKHEAAAIIRKLLDSQIRDGSGEHNSADLARRLVDLVWQEQGTTLQGLPEQSPHKMAIAAFALAYGARSLPEAELSLRAATIALSNVLAEIELNESYVLSSLDELLIGAARTIFGEMLDKFNNPPVVRRCASLRPEAATEHAGKPGSPS